MFVTRGGGGCIKAYLKSSVLGLTAEASGADVSKGGCDDAREKRAVTSNALLRRAKERLLLLGLVLWGCRCS